MHFCLHRCGKLVTNRGRHAGEVCDRHRFGIGFAVSGDVPERERLDGKTRQEWEWELHQRLERAKKELQLASGGEKARALEHYRIALKQFMDFVAKGELPQ